MIKNKSAFATNSVILLALAIILAGVGGYLAFGKFPTREGCIKVVGGVVGIANECRNVSECDFYKKPGDDFINNCYWGVAIHNNDTGICALITNVPMKNGCVENVQQDNLLVLTIPKFEKGSNPLVVSAISPINLEGYVKTGWTTFEGVVGTVTIYDRYSSKLGEAQVQATSDWTKPPVSFKVSLSFSKSETSEGLLKFFSDNPSGDPARQQGYFIPVKFISPGSSNTPDFKIYVTSADKVSGGNYSFQYPNSITIVQDYVYSNPVGYTGPHIVILRQGDDPKTANYIEINMLRTTCDYYKHCRTMGNVPVGTNSDDPDFLKTFNSLLDNFKVVGN